MAELQKDDPLCPYTDKPCYIWHHETIEQGMPCPCKCHWSDVKIDEWGKGLDRIDNADEVTEFIKDTNHGGRQ